MTKKQNVTYTKTEFLTSSRQIRLFEAETLQTIGTKYNQMTKAINKYNKE